ncbi:hypothetical protein, partial [Bordetella bronchiseptica]|uniref:hypothetical protein n=1 Tax=Bordetella bronchiseptica TaxID=518 RepID=UPI001C3F960B
MSSDADQTYITTSGDNMNAFCFRLVYSQCRAMYVPVAPRRRAARRGRGGVGRRLRRALAAAG